MLLEFILPYNVLPEIYVLQMTNFDNTNKIVYMKKAMNLILPVIIVLIIIGIIFAKSFYRNNSFENQEHKFSGTFYILVNESLHGSELDRFFMEENTENLPQHINCFVAYTDLDAIGLARHYQSLHTTGKMTVSKINTALVISKAELGIADVAIISEDIAEALALDCNKSEENGLRVLIREIGGEQ
ncbi:MAG: hypothetical protein K5634_06965 [Sphaerochaetaceae bacterium]|nr:hypothetical protein [Sphaerochaetaceae bacterium]